MSRARRALKAGGLALPPGWSPCEQLDPMGLWLWLALGPQGQRVGRWVDADIVGWVWDSGGMTGWADSLEAACGAAGPCCPVAELEAPPPDRPEGAAGRLSQVLLFPTGRCQGCNTPIAERPFGPGRPRTWCRACKPPLAHDPLLRPRIGDAVERDGTTWWVVARPRVGVEAKNAAGALRTWTLEAWRAGQAPLPLPEPTSAAALPPAPAPLFEGAMP